MKSECSPVSPMLCRQMFEVPDGKGIKSFSLELCDTEPTFQKVCVLSHSTLPILSRNSLIYRGGQINRDKIVRLITELLI